MNNTELFCYISLQHNHYSLKKASYVENSAYKILDYKFKKGALLFIFVAHFLVKIITNF